MLAIPLLGACGDDGATSGEDRVSLTLVTHDSFAVTPEVLESFEAQTLRDMLLERHLKEITSADPERVVICNADEGDSGTFADRMIMESDPFVLIEGMTIAGLAVGVWNSPAEVKKIWQSDREFRVQMKAAARRKRLASWETALQRTLM